MSWRRILLLLIPTWDCSSSRKVVCGSNQHERCGSQQKMTKSAKINFRMENSGSSVHNELTRRTQMLKDFWSSSKHCRLLLHKDAESQNKRQKRLRGGKNNNDENGCSDRWTTVINLAVHVESTMTKGNVSNKMTLTTLGVSDEVMRTTTQKAGMELMNTAICGMDQWGLRRTSVKERGYVTKRKLICPKDNDNIQRRNASMSVSSLFYKLH